MKFEAKEFTLKNGSKCILRSPDENDAAEMLQMRIQAAGESDFLMMYPEEFAGLTPETQAEFIKGTVKSENTLMLTAFVDGKLAGNCSVSFNNRIKTRHRGEIGLGILKEYWGLGIGSIMFDEMIKAAQSRNGVTQLELDVFERNQRALALYEKFGFEIVASRPDAIRLKDGTVLKEFIMVKKL